MTLPILESKNIHERINLMNHNKDIYLNTLPLLPSLNFKQTHLALFWFQISSTDVEHQCIIYNSKNTEKDYYPTAKTDFFGKESS